MQISFQKSSRFVFFNTVGLLLGHPKSEARGYYWGWVLTSHAHSLLKFPLGDHGWGFLRPMAQFSVRKRCSPQQTVVLPPTGCSPWVSAGPPTVYSLRAAKAFFRSTKANKSFKGELQDVWDGAAGRPGVAGGPGGGGLEPHRPL